MIERLLENWLDSASEKSYQLPFAQMLMHQGMKIIHVSRHSPIEHGKDIIALDNSRQIHAYQLKGVGGRKLSLKALQDILPQLQALVFAKIEHPAVKTRKWHKSYLVLNGELEEEASDLLSKINQGFIEKNGSEYQIEVIPKGIILDLAKSMSTRLIPQELTEFRLFLELYLEDGRAFLPKERFVNLILGCLPSITNGKKPKVKEFARSVTSLGLINSLALSSFSKKDNHFAEIEGWILYLSHISASIERYSIGEKYWLESYLLIENWIFSLLRELVIEIKSNPDAYEGDGLTEIFVHRTKITLLEALCSVYAFWCLYRGEAKDDLAQFCKDFIKENHHRVELWGEGAIPQLVIIYWLLRKVEATPRPDFWLLHILETLCNQNDFDSDNAIPNPYYSAESIMLSKTNNAKYRIDDNFAGESFTSEALMHLYVRRNWKQHAKLSWAAFTRVQNCMVKLDQPWQAYLWRNREGVDNISFWPKMTKDWEELKIEAAESEGKGLPT